MTSFFTFRRAMKPTTEQVNFYIQTRCQLGKNASKIHKELTEVWGHDNICSERHVYRTVNEFRSGNRESCSRRIGSGRPSSSTCDGNIGKIKDLIEANPRLSISNLERLTGIEDRSVRRILKEDLGKVSVTAKWVPHKLSDANKQSRMNIGQTLLATLHGNVVVTDEKWLYASCGNNQQNCRAWVSPGGDRPHLPSHTISENKFHIAVAMNFRGQNHFKVFERNETIDSTAYIGFLAEIKQKFRSSSGLSIMHDNARPHVSAAVQNFFQEHNITWIHQPPYSPDMNLMDRFVFRNMEQARNGAYFQNIDDVNQFLETYLNGIRRSSLTNELQRLRTDIQKIINRGGDYI